MYKPPFFKTIEFALAECAVSPIEIAQRLGLETEEWDDDLGPVLATCVHLHGGQPITFKLRLEQTGIATVIYADACDVLATGVRELLALVLDYVNISMQHILWIQQATREDAAELVRISSAYQAEYCIWKVKRLDDNGNTFLLAEGLRKSDADEIVADYTARGHKQLYWAEK